MNPGEAALAETEAGKMGKKRVANGGNGNGNGANLGFEAKLWLAADKLRTTWTRRSISMSSWA